MLFPYTERTYSVPRIGSEFMPSLLDDIQRFHAGFTGYLLLSNSDEAAYLLFKAGVPIARAAFDAETERLRSFDKRLPAPLVPKESFWSAELLGCDEGLIPMLTSLFRNEPTARFSGREMGKALENLAKQPLALLVRRYGLSCELALWEGGAYVIGYRYNRAVGGFLRVGEAQWNDDVEEADQLSVVPACAFDETPVQLPNDPDPLKSTLDKYISVFTELHLMLAWQLGDKTNVGMTRLLQRLKKRYSALYQGVELSEDGRSINWKHILENRNKVDTKYRYDQFFLYLDEILSNLIRGAAQKTENRILPELWKYTDRLYKIAPDKELASTRYFFSKIDRLRKKLEQE